MWFALPLYLGWCVIVSNCCEVGYHVGYVREYFETHDRKVVLFFSCKCAFNCDYHDYLLGLVRFLPAASRLTNWYTPSVLDITPVPLKVLVPPLLLCAAPCVAVDPTLYGRVCRILTPPNTELFDRFTVPTAYYPRWFHLLS